MTEVIDVPKLVEILDEIVSKVPEDYTAICYYSNKGKAYSDWQDGAWGVNDEGSEYGLPRQPFKFEDEIAPVCIAGQVVYKLGGEDALLKLREDTSIAPERGNPYEFDAVRKNADVLRELGLTDDAIEALRKAQVDQDHEKPWPVAVNNIRV